MLLKGSNTRARVLTALENSGYVGDGELIRAARFLEMRDGTEYHEITYVDPEGDKLTKAKVTVVVRDGELRGDYLTDGDYR